VVAAGMGAERAALAVETALATGDVEMLISAGLTGGCVVGAAAGTVMEADVVVDVRTGERFLSSSGRCEGIVLATMDTIASVRQKEQLAARYGAMIVDMEAATVARLARAHGVGFRAIKGVSDGFNFELSSLAKFAGKQGSFRTGAFAAYTAVRPWTWRQAWELGRGSGKALRALNEVLRCVLAGK
jgi:adenosylhomocysteine nucleosidase